MNCRADRVYSDWPALQGKSFSISFCSPVVRPAVVKGLSIPEPFPQEKQFTGFIKATVGLGDLHA